MKKKVSKADLINTKAGKYLTARYSGNNKTQSAIIAEVNPTNITHLERTEIYQAIEKKFFKDEFSAILTVRQLAEELKKNVVQDEDRGAKNAAIKIALDKLEPSVIVDNQENERVMVILK